MGRYDNITLKVNKKGQRVLRPTLYPDIPISDEDKFIRPIDGERLDTLAHRHYQDQSLWWVIAKANEGFKGNIKFKIGERILIPMEIGEIISELERLNDRVE